jgi:hypothetical protein
MGHFSVLIQLFVIVLQLLSSVCELGGGENEPGYAASLVDFGQCKDSNLATFWKDAFLLKHAMPNGHRINSLSGLYINISESDKKARVTYQNKVDSETVKKARVTYQNKVDSETVRHSKLI